LPESVVVAFEKDALPVCAPKVVVETPEDKVESVLTANPD